MDHPWQSRLRPSKSALLRLHYITLQKGSQQDPHYWHGKILFKLLKNIKISVIFLAGGLRTYQSSWLVFVFILLLGGVRISMATSNIALWEFLVLNQSCWSIAVLSMCAWSILDTLPFEHDAAGQKAPDGVAGDSACMDLGGVWQAGMLAWDGKVTGPAPAIYWALHC